MPPGHLGYANERHANKPVRQVYRPVGAPALLLHSEDLLVKLRFFIPVLNVQGNVPDPGSFHLRSSNCLILRGLLVKVTEIIDTLRSAVRGPRTTMEPAATLATKRSPCADLLLVAHAKSGVGGQIAQNTRAWTQV